MMLAYVNNIQALYYHPSLGQPINIALVRLELMQRQPNALAHLDGERGETLDAFCAYAKSINPPNDYDPKHWDMGLYISGLDFYATENGKKNFVTMGLAPVGGVCWDTYACVIAEFGVVNRFGRPYPSTGFTSLYVAAHEIGHNLGMSHDSTGNTCPKDGYIMSPSRGTHGETHWSSCSRDVVSTLATSKRCLLDRPNLDFRHEANQHLDHQGKFGQLPGRRWSAKRQCEILLRDPDAAVDTLKDCCRGLKCSSSKRIGFYFAGPALDGTKCDESRECKAGDCLPIEDEWPLINPPSDNGSGWSNWNDNNCTSGCIRGSLGSFERRRTCLSDTSTCPGLNFDVFLCKDNHLCDRGTRKRLSATEYAGQRCLEFSQHLEVIDGTSGGLQADHEENRPWVACAIFCKRKDIASYYSPKLELNDLGLDAYFPDGTWCHKEGKENYFCRKHHCLSENFRFGKGLTNVNLEENNLLGPMNAKPNDNENHRLPTEVIRYFSLGMNGKPLLTKLTTKNALQVKDNDNNNDDNDDDDDDEDSWLDPKDYIELPTHEQPDEIETPYFM